MKILATAIPNPKYDNFRTFNNIILEARFYNGSVHYWEKDLKRKTEVEIKESTVKDLFFHERPLAERPFLTQPNRKFYICLYRNEEKFKSLFIQFKNSIKNEQSNLQKNNTENS